MIHCMHKSVNLNPVETDVNFMAFYLLMEKFHLIVFFMVP